MDEVQTIEAAVLSFYRGGSEQQKETHKWLQQVQNSPHAWSFCWELMQLNKSSEVQFFGSITLNSKLRNDWAEVPKEAHHELKQKLLETIVVFGNGPKIVLNRLCISLGLFIVHMLRHPTVIEEVTSMFLNQQLGTLSKVTQIEILMCVLEGIPEEVKNVRTQIPRALVCEELNRNAEFVMQTVVTYLNEKLNHTVEPQDMNGMINAAKCTGSWVLHGNVGLDERDNLIQTLLKAIHYCYWKEPKDDGCLLPDDNELAEIALKSLASIISSYSTQNSKYSVTIIRFMKMFLDVLVPILDAEYKECNDNENLALMMYALFISTLEGFSSAIFDGIVAESDAHEVYTRTVDMLIKCTDKPGTYPVDEMCSTYAMEFWYLLQEDVLSMDTSEHRKRCHEAIKPVYAHVVKVLVRKSQLPTDSSMHKWNDDDLEAFRCYRQDIGDTLLSCHDVLSDMMLDVLSEALDESIMYLSYEQQLPSSTDSWTLLEATIHAFCSIAQKIEYAEHPQIVKLLKVLNEIPYEKYHDKLFGMALETVGAYSEWFGDNPKYLPSAIALLVKGLNSTRASQATLGLKDLTSECQKEVVPYAVPLLDACRSTLQEGRLKSSEMIRLMYTVGNILSVIPYENIIVYLDAMVSPCFAELQVHVQNNDTSEPTKARVLLRLEMISKLFSSLNINKTANASGDTGDKVAGQKFCPPPSAGTVPGPVQPILLILQKTMDLLKGLCTLWIHDETVIDTLCKALQQALTTLMDDIKPLLNEMCCLVQSILNTNCVVSAADIAGNFILMFYKDQDCRQMMVQLFTAIMEYNFAQMQLNSDKLSRIADLIETFYAFNTRISKKIPICYSEVQVDCMKLMGYATKCMMLPETAPMKKSVAFITMFVKESPKHTVMMNVVLAQGENILRSTFLCIGGTALRTQVEVFADIFLALNIRYPAEFVQWMKLLEIPNFPTAFVSANEKEQFMRKVIKERVNKRLVQDHVRKFAAVCRNIIDYEGK